MNATATITTESGAIRFPDGTTESGVVITSRLRVAGSVSVEAHACQGRFLLVQRGTDGRIKRQAEVDADTYGDIAQRAAHLVHAQAAAERGLATLVAQAMR